MTDYSKMSDQQINNAVAIARGRLIRKGDSVVFYEVEGLDLCTDFCNSWADAGLIMLSNRIGIEPSVTKEKWVAQTGYFRLAYGHDNPLRAAMIVFLMMKESENVS